ncbi:SLC13 family permease [Rhodopirellula sp. JC740]|uniref:SLC13 family permease n=1 Tax=Rhodopirellula halodulae TaxID=2894198 RepID=A0ABS8NMZ4_9BACT|nr:SLC13 family permease [Rhodopirellula sp. JC740]MCC9644952.1 SLC13 family permease [Rhodopirellula sp. JC740]
MQSVFDPLVWPTIWPMWLTIGVAIALLLGLAFRVAATDLLAVTALSILVVAQDLTGTTLLPDPTDAVAGFGNKGLITIALLFAVVAGLELTGGTELATGWLLSKAKNLRDTQVRMLLPVAAFSGFLNNTPVVAAMLPVVGDLGKRLSISPSRLLLPLSYAAILGGMCTLMGTSTNLLVRDEYNQYIAEMRANGAAMDLDELSFFTPAIAGLPATILGLLYIILTSKWLIPERKQAVSVGDDPQKYTVEMQVEMTGPLVGRTLQEAGLRALPGLYVAEIQRADGRIEPAKPDQRLFGEDILILVGDVDSVVDLRKIRGLITPGDQARKLQIPAWRRTLVEAVVSPRCSLIGKTIREGRFRSNFNAAVVAVARGGRRLEGKLGDVRIEPGDVLLLEASKSFMHQQRGGSDFYLVSSVERGEVRRHERAPLAIAIMVVMVTAAAFDWLSILSAAMVATVAMVMTRCCTTSEARRSIDWSVLIVIGSAIGIGRAMEQSGAAGEIANGLLSIAGGNPLGTLIAVYVATVICTELITNNAAAMLMLPIAWTAATKVGMDPMPMVVAVMIAASASFLTPFGYQTNTMVYGVGGYRLRDYIQFGLPLSLIVAVTTIGMLTWWY